MSRVVSARIRALVRARAGRRCEYCLLHEDDAWAPHEPDHVIAVKHGGRTVADNLAWTCMACNRHKGSDLASINPETGRIVRLFDPRRDRWNRHFRLRGARIEPRTPIGRVTVRLLPLNGREQVIIRRALIAEARYPG